MALGASKISMNARSGLVLPIVLLLLAAACTTESNTNTSSVTSQAQASEATTLTTIEGENDTQTSSASAPVDVDALLLEYGFERCGDREPNDQLTDERREELFRATATAGLGHSADLEPGFRVQLYLYVLNEEALNTLATLVDPSEVCVDGADPEGYVADGPQPLGGPGWRWLGAQSVEVGESRSLITTEAGFDAMWGAFEAGPEPLRGPIRTQPTIDFSHEVVLTIQTKGWGINGGICGIRLDAVNVIDDLIVIDWFRSGGDAECPASYDAGTYAIALDLDVVGPLPLQISLRGLPDVTPALTESLSETDNALLWPLVQLQFESSSFQGFTLQSTELANSIECRLFRRFADAEIVPGADIPPEFLEAVTGYVEATEALLAELGPNTEPPRSAGGWPLRSLIGRPEQELVCK